VRTIALFVRFRPTKARKANETATACPAGRFSLERRKGRSNSLNLRIVFSENQESDFRTDA
jgi:hypothetical protein